MKSRGCLAILTVVLVLCPVLTGASNNAGGQRLVIGSIRIEGNVTVSRKEVLGKARSRVGEAFDPAVAAEDAKRIAELPGVTSAWYDTEVVGNKIILTFVLVGRGTVRSIDFVGNRGLKTNTLRGKLKFKQGDDIIWARFGIETLQEFYLEKGFAFAQVKLDEEQLSEGKVVYVIDEGPQVKIESVIFRGNEVLKAKALKDAINSDNKEWFFWRKDYTAEQVKNDVQKLEDIYYQRGFLDYKIAAKEGFNAGRDQVRIVFEIEEGPQFAVERIVLKFVNIADETVEQVVLKQVSGQGEPPRPAARVIDLDQMRTAVRLEPGEICSGRKAEADRKRLLKLYRERGFIDARVAQTPKFAAGAHVVDLEFEIFEGKQFRIGRIDITGNEVTQDKVIRRVLDEEDFQPGQWYNADAAPPEGGGKLENDIRRTVLAETVTITPVDSDQPGQKHAVVDINEGLTGTVWPGVGLSSDSGVIGQLIYDQRNFDITDWPESFTEFITLKAFKGAGQTMRIALEPGTQVSVYSVDFTEPYLNDKPISLDLFGSKWKRWRESFDEKRLKGYMGLERRYKNGWRPSLGFRAENVEVVAIDEDAPQEIRDVSGNNALVGVKFGLSRDLTDDLYDPSTGTIIGGNYEQVAGEHEFGVLSATHRWYGTLYEDLAERKTILATKLHGATILGDAPPFEKFYAGGTGFYGIRGFDYRGVSTRGLQTNVLNPERKDPIGSDWIFLANAEVIVPWIGKELSWLVFVDTGVIDTGGYRAAVGTGIQIKLPQWFGPVPMRFELAVPIRKDDEDDMRVFSFSAGRLF
jgi:outer membrane protein insertion porin family